MNQHEIDSELAAASGLLAATSAAHLAYLAKDGTPRAMPVGAYWTGQEFIVSTADTAPKVKALTVRPDVAMTIDRGVTPGDARALQIRGRAEITVVDGVVEEYLMAARTTMDVEADAEFEKNVRQMYDRMARIAIAPTWARFYDFNVGRMPKFMQELAAKNMS